MASLNQLSEDIKWIKQWIEEYEEETEAHNRLVAARRQRDDRIKSAMLEAFIESIPEDQRDKLRDTIAQILEINQ